MLQGIHRWGVGLKPKLSKLWPQGTSLRAMLRIACTGLVIIAVQGEVPAAVRRHALVQRV